MKRLFYRRALGFGLLALVATIAFSAGTGYAATTDAKPEKKKQPQVQFPLLQIESRTYTNATVTPEETDIFITHAGGIANVKVASLPVELKQKLGYEIPKPKTNVVAQWTMAQVSKIRPQDLQTLEQKLRSTVPVRDAQGTLNPNFIYLSVGACLLLHLLLSFCYKRVCEKANYPPGPVVWIPVLQIIPLVRAAGLPPVWFVIFLLPGLNVLAYVVWCIKMAKVRGKGGGLAFLLIFPLTSLFAFLYLAFSNGAPAKAEKKPRRPELMTLEAA